MDAIQSLTGCTYGKGNLIHLDYGKNAFTFIRRSDDKAIRIITKPDGLGKRTPEQQALFEKVNSGQASAEEKGCFQQQHIERAWSVITAPLDDLFIVKAVEPIVPAHARLHNSVQCAGCGEMVMETRAHLFRGEAFCTPCFEARDRRYSA